MNPDKPTPRQVGVQVTRLIGKLAVHVLILRHGPEEARVAVDAMEARMAEGRRAVRGNRRSGPVSIGDMRLFVASDLRILLEELDSH